MYNEYNIKLVQSLEFYLERSKHWLYNCTPASIGPVILWQVTNLNKTIIFPKDENYDINNNIGGKSWAMNEYEWGVWTGQFDDAEEPIETEEAKEPMKTKAKFKLGDAEKPMKTKAKLLES